MQDLEKTHLFQYQNAVGQITKPLFDCSNINFFAMGRLYADGSTISLSNYPNLCADAITKKAAMTFHHLAHILEDKNDHEIDNFHYYLHKKNNSATNQILIDHGFDNGIVLVDPQAHYADCFVFAASKELDIMSDYFSNWDQLSKFCHYFLDRTNPIITKLKKTDRIFLRNNNNNPDCKADAMFDRKKFDRTIELKHYYLSYNKQRYKLTAKQFQCLKLLAQGLQINQIADNMSRSPRTIRDYQERLEILLGVDNRQQLCEIFKHSNLVGL